MAHRLLYLFLCGCVLGSVDKIKDYGQNLKRPFSLAGLMQSRSQGPLLFGPIRERGWNRVLI